MARQKRDIYEFHIEISSKITSVFFMGILYILIYPISAIRFFIRDTIYYINSWLMYLNITISSDLVKRIYHIGELFFILFFGIYILYNIVIRIVFFFLRRRKNSVENRFEESLIRYLNNNPLKQCYLLTGGWGSGKTHAINCFFEKYYKYTFKKVYRISCFGLNTREQVEKEISSQIEVNDNSMYTACINVIKYIPILGEFLGDLLKPNYSIGNVPKGTVFIFDDFERATSRGLVNKRGEIYYEKQSSSLTHASHEYREFDEINKELQKIEDGFSMIAINENMHINQLYLEKYNAIIGIINELVESYGMRVVIVCNADILGYEYVNSIFRGKLNCITYNQTINYKSIVSIMEIALDSIIFNSKIVKNTARRVLQSQIENDAEKIMQLFGNNLRYMENLIYAYLDTLLLFEDSAECNLDFVEDLFYNICVIHYLYYSNNLDHVEKVASGACLKFFLELFHKYTDQLSDFLQLKREIKWIDINLSGFWILNMSKPSNIQEIMNLYNSYSFYNVEKMLFEGNTTDFEKEGQDIKLEHVLYTQCFLNSDFEKDYSGYLWKVNLSSMSNLGKNIDELLSVVMEICQGRFHSKFNDSLFKVLYSHYQVKAKGRTSYIYNAYNQTVDKLKE